MPIRYQVTDDGRCVCSKAGDRLTVGAIAEHNDRIHGDERVGRSFNELFDARGCRLGPEAPQEAFVLHDAIEHLARRRRSLAVIADDLHTAQTLCELLRRATPYNCTLIPICNPAVAALWDDAVPTHANNQ